MLKDLN